jgi:hypothetical protein
MIEPTIVLREQQLAICKAANVSTNQNKGYNDAEMASEVA